MRRPTRRGFLSAGVVLAAGAGCPGRLRAATAAAAQPTAAHAFADLAAGNARFAAGSPRHHLELEARRIATVGAQRPFALVLACADSRVAPELIFDQSIGALFVVRVAGNYATTGGVGSFEYAVEHFHSPLLVVLGHSGCGAVKATLAAVEEHASVPGDLGRIIDALRPAVVASRAQPGDALENAIRENVRFTARNLTADSPVLRAAAARGRLRVARADYTLANGRVTFF